MEPTTTDTSRDGRSPGAGVPDEQALLLFLEGDQAMFSELVRRYERPLYAFLVRLTGDREGAADLFQETFVHMWRSARTFRRESRFKTWLYAIAANAWRSSLRRRHDEVSLNEGDPLPAPDAAPGAAGALESEEIGARIGRAVGTLPPEQREVFVLRIYEKMDYAAIAATLNRPLGTVKSQMRLAVFRLRNSLRDLARAYGIS